MDQKTAEMFALMHSENVYIIALLSGMYPESFNEKEITPRIEEYNIEFKRILGMTEQEGITS